MEFGTVKFGDGVLSLEPLEIKPFSVKDLAEMFGFNTDVSDIPPMSDIDTLHRRNTTAIKRSLKCS